MAAYVQSARVSTSGTNATVMFNFPTATGNALVVAGRISATSPSATCSDSESNTYVHAGGIYNANGAVKFQTDVFVTANAAGGATPETVTYTSSVTGTIDVAIHEYRGLVQTNAGILDPTGFASAIDAGGGGSTSPSSGSKTPANQQCILFGAFGFSSGTPTFTAGNMGTGTTATMRQGINNSLITVDNFVLSTESYQANGTLSAAENWSALLVTLVAPPLAYGLTAAEIAAEAAAVPVKVVDYAYPPYCVDRYVVNVQPGVTAMDPAFNSAVTAAFYNTTPPLGNPPTNPINSKGGATVTWGQTGPYLLTTPINCAYGGSTGDAPGIIMRNIGSCDWGGESARGGANIILSIPAPGSGIPYKRSIGFDCTGNDSIVFIDLCMTTGSSAPQCGILFARNLAQGNLFNRLVRPHILGQFSICAVYNFGSENDTITDGYIGNEYVGVACATLIFTASNINNMVTAYSTDPTNNPLSIANSPYSTTIGHPVSTTVHDLQGMSLANLSYNSGSDVVRLDGTQGYHQRGGWMGAPSCRSMWYNDQSTVYTPSGGSPGNVGTAQDTQIRDVRFEHVAISVTENISGITQATSAVVTISSSAGINPFVHGNLVTFVGVVGMTQINGLLGSVTATGGVTTAWTVTTNINSSAFSPFSATGSPTLELIGEPLYGFCYGPVNTSGGASVSASSGLVLSGCHFDTLSPAVTTLDSNTTILEMLYENNVEQEAGYGIVVPGKIEYSTIISSTTVNVAGTLSNSTIIGTPSNWLITTNAGNNNFMSIQGGIAGVATFNGTGGTSASVTIPSNARPSSGISYYVTLGGNANGYCWVSGQTSSGFTVNCSAAPTTVNGLTVAYRITMV
jgi:hypothetical protein